MLETPSPTQIYRFGLFEADVAHKTLMRNGVRIKIQEQPFRVLLLLLERPGEIVARETLRQSLWPDGTYVDFDGSLNVILKKLRFSIDDNSDNPRFIETVPRHGYRFIAPVIPPRNEPKAVTDSSRLIVQEVGANPGSLSIQPTSIDRRSLFYSAALVVFAVVFIATWTHWSGSKSIAGAASAPPAPIKLRKSVAVLGFQNLSGLQSDAWMGTALSEMLSTELASGDRLRMVSTEDVANLWTYSPWAKADTLDQTTTSRIGTALNGDLLVLGSFATIGKPEHGQLRVDVRLQDCKSGEVITEIAEIGATEDLFGIVSRIGGELRSRLGIPHIGDSDELMVHATLPLNPEAARFYSLGLEKLRTYDFQVASGLFEQAIKSDPKFPLAHSMLSRTDLFLGHFDQAKAEAKQGMDLASGLPRVQRMEIEASFDQATGDRGKAADIYRILFNLFPDSLDYGLQLAKLQLESYHPDESLETIRQLRQLPSPARDDALIDLREASIAIRNNPDAAEKLYLSAAQKALSHDKRQVYAKAEQNLCHLNLQHLQKPPECREAFDTFTAAGNRDLAGSTLQIMAENQRLTGHELDAIPLYQQAIDTLEEAGDYEGVGVALNNLSLVFENEGKWDRAEIEYRKARQNFATVNDRLNLAIAVGNIADIEQMRGNFKNAGQLYRESGEIAVAAKAAQFPYPNIGRAGLLLIKGEIDGAVAEIKPQIGALRSSATDPWETATALSGYGDIQRLQGNLNDARKSYEEAIEILAKVNASSGNDQAAIAQLAIDEGHPEAAERQLHDVIAAFEKDKNAGEELGGYLVLCRTLLAQNKIPETKVAIERAKKLTDLHDFPVLSMPIELIELRMRVAEATHGTPARETLLALQHNLNDLIQRAHRIGFYTEECEARLALGEVEMRIVPALGAAHLSALASEATERGYALYVDQAGRIKSQAIGTIASNKPAH